ncbi:putative quinol monooxygenase [Litorimonas sp. RW-G-Af-16]|uniref:putative quinol monooxygenase n=1 Tax=Litorimonas sp. RW-G-Af-16 TaxID=3241168 RepID=UPI00390C7E84
MFTVSGYADVPEADRAAFAKGLPEHTRLTLAEPGCHFFSVKPHPTILGRYIVNEAFDDEAAYKAHIKRANRSEWAKISRNIKRSY